MKTPSIPPVPLEVDMGLKRILDPIKEIVELREGKRGDPLQRFVTFQDMIDMGLITEGDVPDA